jgi:hypothetical protein
MQISNAMNDMNEITILIQKISIDSNFETEYKALPLRPA